MNPIIAASLITSASTVLGRAVGPAAPAGPSISGNSSVTSGGALDFSGWTVSTGGNGGTSSAVGAPHPVTTSAAMPGGLDLSTLALYALVAVVVIKVWGK